MLSHATPPNESFQHDSTRLYQNLCLFLLDTQLLNNLSPTLCILYVHLLWCGIYASTTAMLCTDTKGKANSRCTGVSMTTMCQEA